MRKIITLFLLLLGLFAQQIAMSIGLTLVMSSATEALAVVRPIQQCTSSLSRTGASFSADGGMGSVNVMTLPSRNWNSVSNASWITLTSGSSGVGDGTVNTGGPRVGTITIAGQAFTVSSAGQAESPLAIRQLPALQSLPEWVLRNVS